MTATDELRDACHVAKGQLKCNACNHRIRTRICPEYHEPMYPFCPWCGAPVTVEAQKLAANRRTDDRDR